MKKAILLIAVVWLPLFGAIAGTPYRLLVGTYSDGHEPGIYAFGIDPETGATDTFSSVSNVINPSYLSLWRQADGTDFVYAVSENGRSSAVNAFAFDAQTGRLQRIHTLPAPGADPCYIAAQEKHLVTADYSSGTITVYARETTGGIAGVQQIIRHTGTSVHPERQRSPHIHQTIFTPDGQLLLATDLGTDRIISYRYHPEDSLPLMAIDTLTVNPGSGPRHLTFYPDPATLEIWRTRFTTAYVAFVLGELDGRITTIAIDDTGQMQQIDEATVVPFGDGEQAAADIRVTPDGGFLYATNRAEANTLLSYKIMSWGKPHFQGEMPTGGQGPRNFALTPDGKYIFVANQYTGTIVVFLRDALRGNHMDTGIRINVKQPVCLLFY